LISTSSRDQPRADVGAQRLDRRRVAQVAAEHVGPGRQLVAVGLGGQPARGVDREPRDDDVSAPARRSFCAICAPIFTRRR
jgi:hypothetical protein